MKQIRFWLLSVGLVLLPALTTNAQTQKVAQQFSATSLAVPLPVRQEARPEPWDHLERGPVAGLKVFAREKSGVVWLGGEQGAARFDPRAHERWDRWQYFAARRWLPDDAVRNIWIDPAATGSTVWIRTQTGVARIAWTPMTLADKAARFEERIEARHVRHGFVAGSRLRVAGDLTTSETTDNDNDGLWTAMYLGAQAYRFAVTHDPAARTRAQRALHALLRLEEITGVPGFYARSFVSTNEPTPQGGEWHPTPDGRWLWKGDTSSDESVGHYYGYALYFDLVADAAEKEAIKQVVTRMTDYLIRHDYELLDLDGKPTLWGRWSEKYFATEEGKYEAPLRAIELLAFLKTAHHLTGEPRFAAAYADRLRHGYAEQMRNYRRWLAGGEINFSDDELAYLSYDPLLRYERDPALRKIYLDGLRFTWGKIRSDRNPLWNYISVASGAGRMDAAVQAESRRTLERIPMDQIEWGLRNSHRLDVEFEPEQDRFARPQLTAVLAPDERAVNKWNSNPYRPDDGGGGLGEDDGTWFLLPYWMGRYHGWVK